MASAHTLLPDRDVFKRCTAIYAKNDAFRSHLIGGQVVLTHGVNDLDNHFRRRIVEAVQAFDTFLPKNYPYGEHDFGAVTVGDAVYFWKIDYYDNDLQNQSLDPADDAVTHRVLTIMQAVEY